MIKTEETKNEKNNQWCFRLLNSEIGNDLAGKGQVYFVNKCFRLLNSEIGNDPSNIKMASEWGLRP